MHRLASSFTQCKFWQHYLLHWLIFWLALGLSNILMYSYSSLQIGASYYVAATDAWQRNWPKFLNNQEFWMVGLLVFVAEGLYHYAFRPQSFRRFLISTLFASVALSLLVTALTSWRIGKIAPFYPQVVCVTTIYALRYALIRDIFYQRFRLLAVQATQAETALNALQAHLNPHFFFNTLNTLYGTALEEAAPRTADCIEQLAGLLRYTLREAQRPAVPVAHEVQFVEDYLHLQRLRLPIRPNIEVCANIYYDKQPTSIAPLLLLPLLENAFTYGISIDQKCWLHLDLHIAAGQLTLHLQNRILANRDRHSGMGTGLSHVRQRLALLYPHHHELTVREAKSRYTVNLVINLEKRVSTII